MVVQNGFFPPAIYEKCRRWDPVQRWYYIDHEFTPEEEHRIGFLLERGLLTGMEWNYNTDSFNIFVNRRIRYNSNNLLNEIKKFKKTYNLKHNKIFRGFRNFISSVIFHKHSIKKIKN